MGYIVHKRSGKKRRWWYLPEKKDFHTQYGALPKAKVKPGTVDVGGEEFVIFEASFSDAYHAMKREAQIITRKDIGYIIAHCALGKTSVVVESGAGSGGATIMLARVCKKVHSYEIRKDNIKVVEKNLKKLDLTNVSLKNADFYEEKEVKKMAADAVLLDLPEPWRAFASATKSLKSGGFLVAYTPTITQAQQFVKELPEEFIHERTMELIDRDWKVQGRAIRPVNASIGHTAFLTFCRKV